MLLVPAFLNNWKILLEEINSGQVGGAGDSSGFKMTILDDYLESKWKKMKGWQELHVVISIHDVSARHSQ